MRLRSKDATPILVTRTLSAARLYQEAGQRIKRFVRRLSGQIEDLTGVLSEACLTPSERANNLPDKKMDRVCAM